MEFVICYGKNAIISQKHSYFTLFHVKPNNLET